MTATDEDAAKEKALEAFTEKKLKVDYVDPDYFDFCFEEIGARGPDNDSVNAEPASRDCS